MKLLKSPIFRIVTVAFVLRLLFVLVAHTYRFRPGEDHFEIGWEMGRIARSLAQGHGFASPFSYTTPPTAWEPPLYCYLMAGVFKLFGVYTKLSAFVLLLINCVFGALTCVPIQQLGERVLGERPARWAAWTWAVLPYTIYWATRIIWETSITTFLLTVVLVLTLDLAEGARLGKWLWYGVLWGALALLNPAVLSLSPFLLAWILWRGWQRDPRMLAHTIAMLVLAAATIAPWQIRNQLVFGRFVFIRSNFGAEFRMGNAADSEGLWMHLIHPNQSKIQRARYLNEGEVAYTKDRGREAVEWIKANPGRFVVISLRRAWFFWDGLPRANDFRLAEAVRTSLYLAVSLLAWFGLVLALWRRARGAGLFAIAMIVFPLPYYIVFVLPRYRVPIEPEMLLLACYLISQAKEFGGKDQRVEDAEVEMARP